MGRPLDLWLALLAGRFRSGRHAILITAVVILIRDAISRNSRGVKPLQSGVLYAESYVQPEESRSVISTRTRGWGSARAAQFDRMSSSGVDERGGSRCSTNSSFSHSPLHS